MDVLSTEWIGSIAGVLTTVSFLPQVYQAWKTKSTETISMPMLIMMTSGVFLWLVYGILINQMPVIIPNFFTLLSVFVLLRLKLKFK